MSTPRTIALVTGAGLRAAAARFSRAAVAAALCWHAIAHGAPNYRLEIDAPPELEAPLREQTLVGRWRDEPGFDPGQFDLFVARARDEARVIAQAAGYYAARIDVEHRVLPSGESVIRIAVVPGKRTTVAQVSLAFAGAVAGTPAERALRERWPLPAGAVFRFGEWELAKRQLLEALRAQGYLRAKIVQSRADVDPGDAKASLELGFDSGPVIAFDGFAVQGLRRYPLSIVRDLRPWREGEPYSFDRVLDWRQRLQASGYFNSVSVAPDLAALDRDPALGAVPVKVEVNERPARDVTAGVGYSTDQGARALAGYDYRNVLGRGWILQSGALVERITRRLFATVSTPWDASAHRFQGGARVERQDITGELVERNTVFVGRGRRTGDLESFLSLQYQIEHRSVDTGGATPGDRRAALSLGYAWNLRRLDSRVDPRSGYTVSAQFSGAAQGLGSDRSFARLYARGMRFWPMPRDSRFAGGSLIGLVEAGWVIANSADDIPTENLFRAGGAQSIRGYAYQSLGVRQGDAIVGGRVLALASLEYQHPIAPKWFVATFYDRGNAADTWAAWQPVSGYGVGLRWQSPVGPVNLDLAYGQALHQWRAHFSVGYSF